MERGFRSEGRAVPFVSVLVETSVWSLAMRRDAPAESPAVELLSDALSSGREVYTTGIILQELLQGFSGPKTEQAIIQRFAAIPLLVPDREDHVAAAGLRNQCRRQGVQIGTIDALIAQLSIRFELDLLTTDKDFEHAAKIIPIKLAL